jgi:WD40 repeat protein
MVDAPMVDQPPQRARHLGPTRPRAADPVSLPFPQDLAALAWVAPPTSHPDDARVAVAGDAGAVSVISVADCAVVALARGHASPVVDLAGAPRLLGAVASLDRGGSVALWRVGAARAACAAALAVGDATVLALAPDGSFLLTGHKSGAVQRWSLDGLWGEEEGEGDASTAESLPAPTPATPTPVTPAGARRALDAPVTAMRMLTPTSVAVLGADGRGAVLDLDTTNTTTSLRCSFRAPGARLLGGSGGGCRLASTRDGALLAVGGPAGEAAVLDSATGKAIISLPPPPRVKAAARAVGVSDDGRHVLVAAGGGFIFRQEARPVEGEESGGGKENEGGGD